MIVTARRACAILFNLLSKRADRRPFLLPANICPVVPLTFLKSRMSFEFVDIDPVTLGMDSVLVRKRVRSGKFGGLLYAHTYGNPDTPRELFAEIKQANEEIMVIDDRCLCIPDLEPGRGNPADVLLYSTGYAKIMDIGFGGYGFIRDDLDYRPHALPFSEVDLATVEAGYKASLAGHESFAYVDSDWLQMGPAPRWEDLCQQITQALPASLEQRRKLNAIYHERIPDTICLPEKFQLWRFNLRFPDKLGILRKLQQAGLFASSHYASLAGIFAPGHCPQAETLHAKVVNLFNDQHYTIEMAEQTCDIIRTAL